MTPQPRGIIPPGDLDRLLRAQALVKEAQAVFELAVTQALEAGGSVREVHESTGLSATTMQKYGHANGWPSPARRAHLDADKIATAEFSARLDAVERILRSLGEA
ncbi:hypothetical protein [Glaciibacter superstes]|uniref:hypothetical protein n=1 Tax=Glaciibacter superstes TaxID=501023 RepID=UPI0003B4BAA9|nr:hypothetical protein [Glaciibacter superstes]